MAAITWAGVAIAQRQVAPESGQAAPASNPIIRNPSNIISSAQSGNPANPWRGSNGAINHALTAGFSMSPEEADSLRQFQAAVARLRRSQSEDERKELREQVKSLVALQVEKDLKQREQDLADMETRAAALRSQLETRRNSVDQTLNALMMLIENPTTGLGVSEQWMRSIMANPAGDYNDLSGPTHSNMPTLPSTNTSKVESIGRRPNLPQLSEPPTPAEHPPALPLAEPVTEF